MPLKKGKSKETISKNIKSEMEKFKKTGKIGTSKPKNKKKAQKQATAIALSKAREFGAKIPKKKKTLAKESFDNYITDLLKESMGLSELDAIELASMNDVSSHDHNDPDESEFPTKLKELPKGEYFKRKPDSKKVWVKGDHVRFYKKGKIIIRYSCTAADDMNQEIFLNPLAPVYTEFEY